LLSVSLYFSCAASVVCAGIGIVGLTNHVFLFVSVWNFEY
jgi:hypothetical protein